jgi:ribonuclease HII
MTGLQSLLLSGKKKMKPSFAEERKLAAQGYRLVAGVDEVGRGALAGPVVAAAVILPTGLDKARWLDEVRDSKELSPARRQLLFEQIMEMAISVGLGRVDGEIIDAQGIVRATRLAMKQAIDQLSPPPECLLIDYLTLPESPLPQKGIVDGDRLCLSIACASIIAKVARDRLMVEFDEIYPGYGLAEHKGYGTREHLARLRRLGPSPIHRHSFQPVKELLPSLG